MFSSRITSKLQPSMWRASPWFEPSGVILGGLMITATGLLGYYVYRDLVVNPSSRLRPSERKDPDYIPSMDKADRFYSSPFRALENRPIAISPSLSSRFGNVTAAVHGRGLPEEPDRGHWHGKQSAVPVFETSIVPPGVRHITPEASAAIHGQLPYFSIHAGSDKAMHHS